MAPRKESAGRACCRVPVSTGAPGETGSTTLFVGYTRSAYRLPLDLLAFGDPAAPTAERISLGRHRAAWRGRARWSRASDPVRAAARISRRIDPET